MKKGNLIAILSRIREKANHFIVKELEERGIFGIVPSHGDILGLLFHGEVLTMQEIAIRIHRTKPTVTVLVDKLVKLGYVQKDKCTKDQRVTYVSLTEAGWTLRPLVDEISDLLNEIVYRGLTEKDAEALEKTLAEVQKNFD